MSLRMPKAEVIDRFTIALAKISEGQPELRMDAVRDLVNYAPNVEHTKYRDALEQLLQVNRNLFKLEDQLSLDIKYMGTDRAERIATTAVAIRINNLKRCKLKQQIAAKAGETCDAGKFYLGDK